MTTIDACRLIKLPCISRQEGNITPVHSGGEIPFRIERVYYLYDVPGGESRGGHAHRNLEQVLVSVMGCFDVILDDGFQRKSVSLNRAYFGLYLPRLVWRELENFSSGGICLVLASHYYEENDYIRDYDEFLRIKRTNYRDI
jgi:hypothetical protein